MTTPAIKTLNTHQRTWLARATAALLAASAVAAAPHANASAFISVNIAPPALPVYEQPYMPGPGYLWEPGYWAWDGDISDYYWVPGTWVRAPYVGALWTPGYWGYETNAYAFHPGYWGPHIGYYGGINYGFGYFGLGYAGGYWRHGGFYYNSAYNRYGSGVHISFYNKPFEGGIPTNHFSFNGPGGIVRAETADEHLADHDHHIGADAEQTRHMEMARHDETLRSKVNHGTPALAATSHAAAFEHGHEVAASHETAPTSHGSATTHSSDHHHTHSDSSSHHTSLVEAPHHGASPNPGQPEHTSHASSHDSHSSGHDSHASHEGGAHKDDHKH